MGGGAKSEFWRGMIADTMDIPVKTMQSDEGPALGVAILAGCGAGIYESVAEGCKRAVKTKSKTAPVDGNNEKYKKYYNIYKTLYPSLMDAYKELKKADFE